MADFLLLIRSGKTAYDHEGRIKGTLDVPLSPEGVEEAHAFADRALRLLADHATISRAAAGGGDDAKETPPIGRSLHRLFASTARCGRETAEIVGRRLGLKPQACRGLENLDHGLWQGLRVDEIEERQPRIHRQWLENPWSVAPPEGELLDECCDRVASTLERIARRQAAGGIAAVVPEPLGRVIRWVVAGEPLGDLWRPVEGDEGVRLVSLADQWTIRPRPASRPPSGPVAHAAVERFQIPFFNG